MGETSEMFFISYASEDRARVRPVWERLRRDFPGVKFWFDDVDIPAAAEWDLEIRKAIRSCNAIIVMLSASSVEKEGYVQREFKWAMERVEEMPEGDSFLFPTRLDPCLIPYRLSKWQACDLFGDDTGYTKLKQGIRARLEQLRKMKAGENKSLPKKRIALIATEKFPLHILEGVYREYTSKLFQRHSGLLPTYDLEQEHGAAKILPADPKDAQYAWLDRQIHLFHPDWIMILGMGLTQAGGPGVIGELVVPRQIHTYSVLEGVRNDVKDFELGPDRTSFTANLQLVNPDPNPSAHRIVGAFSTQMDLALLRTQTAETDLEVIEMVDSNLFSIVSRYTKDWLLLSAIAGHLGSPSLGLESAGYAVSKKVMEVLGLDKQI